MGEMLEKRKREYCVFRGACGQAHRVQFDRYAPLRCEIVHGLPAAGQIMVINDAESSGTQLGIQVGQGVYSQSSFGHRLASIRQFLFDPS
jgi:hypothetical protein